MNIVPAARNRRPPRWPLVVVLGVVVAAGVWVGLSVREHARRVARERCATNLKQIGQAILLYTNENRNRYPDTFATLQRSGPAVDVATFVCPAGATPASADDVGRGSYRLIADSMPERIKMLSGRAFMGRGDTIAGECVAIEVPGHHAGGVHVLMDDGSVRLRAVATNPGATWADVQDDVIHDRPIRWPASQPTR